MVSFYAKPGVDEVLNAAAWKQSPPNFSTGIDTSSRNLQGIAWKRIFASESLLTKAL
jgi:hypothetical protein